MKAPESTVGGYLAGAGILIAGGAIGAALGAGAAAAIGTQQITPQGAAMTGGVIGLMVTSLSALAVDEFDPENEWAHVNNKVGLLGFGLLTAASIMSIGQTLFTSTAAAPAAQIAPPNTTPALPGAATPAAPGTAAPASTVSGLPKIYDATQNENGRTLTIRRGDSVRIALGAAPTDDERDWRVHSATPDFVAMSAKNRSWKGETLVETSTFTGESVGMGKIVGRLGERNYELNVKVI